MEILRQIKPHDIYETILLCYILHVHGYFVVQWLLLSSHDKKGLVQIPTEISVCHLHVLPAHDKIVFLARQK